MHSFLRNPSPRKFSRLLLVTFSNPYPLVIHGSDCDLHQSTVVLQAVLVINIYFFFHVLMYSVDDASTPSNVHKKNPQVIVFWAFVCGGSVQIIVGLCLLVQVLVTELDAVLLRLSLI